MARRKLGQVAAVILVGAAGIVTMQCSRFDRDRGKPKGAEAVEIAPPKSWQRVAAGGGLVTVDVTVLSGSGSIPSWSVPPSDPDTIAVFSNHAEGGKREKRYDLKRSDTASYKLVLSNDGSGKTKWTMLEVVGATMTLHRSGHLWPCDSVPHPDSVPRRRDVGFKDCTIAVTYNPIETALAPFAKVIFASYLMPPREAPPPEDAAAWISCTSGCCSLGT
jgi:hypothetical protein